MFNLNEEHLDILSGYIGYDIRVHRKFDKSSGDGENSCAFN